MVCTLWERILYIVTLRMVSRQAVRPDICRGGLGERNMLEVLKAFEANEYRGGFSMEYVDARSFRNPEKWDRQTVEQFESCLERM